MIFLKRFRAPKPTFSAALAPDRPFFAIGDIHGREDLLIRLLEKMAERAPDLPLIFVGDYIDRGEQSAQVLARLMELQRQAPERVTCLAGNHEDMLLKFLKDPASNGPRWMRYGGLQTMSSCRLSAPRESAEAAAWEEARDQLAAALPAGCAAWLEDLPIGWDSGNVAVIHAGLDPLVPPGIQSRQTLLWGHPDFATTPREDGIWVVHGHTITSTPLQRAGRISIDTGAYATGRLTAALIQPGAEVEFLQT